MENNIQKAVENIFTTNLGVKASDNVLVFSDTFTSDIGEIGRLVTEAGRKFTDHISYVEYNPTGCHGVEPPEELWKEAFGEKAYETLKEKKLFHPLCTKQATETQQQEIEGIIKTHKADAASAVIALSYYSTSHTAFRDILNRICGARFASMPLFDRNMLTGPMMVDWKKMSERTVRIAERVNRCEEIHIASPNGTSIVFSKKGREARMDTGIITGQGQFSNLPAGEVYLAPLEESAEGTLVLEWAPTRKLHSPVILHVEKGMVRNIEGREEYADFLEKKLSEKNENRNIAELGIGTNDRASRPENILESEKIFGTIHIALGDNSSFGGKIRTSFHQDFIFFHPTITLIDQSGMKRLMMSKGKLLPADERDMFMSERKPSHE
jgi:leucyl aminopeptidase (aminopeptidase T)